MESNRPLLSKVLPCLLSGACVLTLTGCLSLRNSTHHQSSSVVQFLYPGNNQPFVQPTIPTLRLPLRVGVAFVPSPGLRVNTVHLRTRLPRHRRPS